MSAAAQFRRGDASGNGILDIIDAISSLAYQFLGICEPTCIETADVDDDVDDDGIIDVTDPVLFLGVPAPVPLGLCSE